MPHPRARNAAVAIALVALLAGASCSGDDATTSPPATRRSTRVTTTTARSTTTGAPTTGGTATADAPVTTTPAAAAPDTGFPADWTPPSLRWAQCTGPDDDPDAECATIDVPRDWSHPAGPTVTLALARYRATGTRTGTLFSNPGGPGGSGIEFLMSGPLDDTLRRHFDLVSWDPRGVGRSTRVRCRSKVKPFLHLDPDPDTPGEQTAIDDAARAVADECRQSDGDLLPFVGTDDVARDLEALRLAVGDPKLNYLGFSYGTFLGTRYAALFPTHIRAMVLDGPLDPTMDLEAGLAGQAKAFDAALDRAFAACSVATGCPVADLAATYDRVKAKVEQSPMAGSRGRTLGPAELATGAIYAGYDKSLWGTLGKALAAADRGRPNAMLDLADGYYDLGSFTAYAGVECLDSASPRGAVAWQAFSDHLLTISPRFGGSIANELLPCAFWPAPVKNTAGRVDAPGSPPIMVVGNTGDPATPYENATNLAAMLSSGVLVTYHGEGHTSYGRDNCVDGAVDDYLVSTTVPATDPQCGR